MSSILVLLGRKLLLLAIFYLLLTYGGQIFGVAGSPTILRPQSAVLVSRDDIANLKVAGSSIAARDLYGLGVRLGFYLQGSAWIFHLLRPDKESGRGLKLACGSITIAILASWTV